MLFVLSPAKTLDYNTPAPTVEATVPAFMSHSSELIEVMRSLSPAQIAGLMRISDPLAQLNAIRYASWAQECTRDNAKQAVFAFNGDVYEGLHAASLDSAALQYAQSRIRILSGLYGLLRPLDLMQAYRLEMGTPLANSRGRNLYAFWGDTITHALNAMAEEHAAGMLVNLASEEYFKSVRVTALRLPVITPVFEDWKAGRYKVISFHAKRARGLMARYAAQNRLTSPEQLAAFDLDGYAYDPSVSTDAKPVFRRKQAA